MSMSSSPALDGAGKASARPFHYADVGEAQSGTQPLGGQAARNAISLEQAAAQREEGAREAGRREGEASVRAACEIQLERARESLRLALEAFASERHAYFRQVETEVVQLALSVARKILHREAQIDPLLLAGMVRVALDQIEANTKVTVRVHPRQGADCRAFFSHADAEHMPEIVEDAAVELDRCVLQTELGTTELGIEVQLKEIEQGLLDLMSQRPDRAAQ